MSRRVRKSDCRSGSRSDRPQSEATDRWRLDLDAREILAEHNRPRIILPDIRKYHDAAACVEQDVLVAEPDQRGRCHAARVRARAAGAEQYDLDGADSSVRSLH